MLTQKEIMKSIEDKWCNTEQINAVKFAFDLQRQEAIKECKLIKQNKFWIYESGYFIFNFLKEHYSITEEELK